MGPWYDVDDDNIKKCRSLRLQGCLEVFEMEKLSSQSKGQSRGEILWWHGLIVVLTAGHDSSQKSILSVLCKT